MPREISCDSCENFSSVLCGKCREFSLYRKKQEEKEDVTMNIFKDGVLIDINVSFWSGAKVLTAEDLGLKKENIAEAYKLGRKMLIPEEVIRKFRAIESCARRIVEKSSYKFPIGNARFVPRKKFSEVIEKLKDCQARYNGLVNDLITRYDDYCSEMVPVYRQAAETAFDTQEPVVQESSTGDREAKKEAFIEAFMNRIKTHYPSPETLRSRFSLTWDLYEIALPKIRRSKDKDILDVEDKKIIAEEEYRAQIRQKVNSFVEDVVKVLRQQTIELCNKIISNIKEGKIIKERTLKSLKEFIDNFSEMNFVGDSRIEEELDTLKRDFLEVYTPRQISEEAHLQELESRLGYIVKAASDMTDINSVTGEYLRLIDWE